MPDLDLCFTPATELAEGIRNRDLSSEAVVRNALERIEQVNGTLNCFVFTYPDEAIELARAADAAVARGDELGVLHGVPIAIKDLTPTAGKRTTFGSYAFEHHVPERSALLVERLLGAGAIMVGKTATPEFAYSSFTDSPLWGVTRNPWNTERSPGGSSGGSAAALAAGFGPLSFGSDIGGSLRVPAHGVYAHKPTFGLVPMGGYGPPPLPPIRNSDLAVVGPMARTAADLALALEVVAGPDEAREGIGYRLVPPPPRHAKLSEYRVLVMSTHPLLPTGRDVRAAIDRLADRLGKAGAQVSRANALLPDLKTSAPLYMRLLGAVRGAGLSASGYAAARRSAAMLSADDHSLAAERARGAVISHRDWIAR